MTVILKESSKKVSYTEQRKRAKKMVNKKITYETMNEDKTVVQQMEEEWPQMTAEFRRLQREQYELFLHKQHDYGPGT